MKKQKSRWGVRFAGIALVAGMIVYLFIINNNTTYKSQSQVIAQNSTLQYQKTNNNAYQNYSLA